MGKREKIIIFVLVIIAIVLSVLSYQKYTKEHEEKENEIEIEPQTVTLSISGNSLDEFDLYFLKNNNEGKNVVFSPLSIKYALAMLKEGANGASKIELTNALGAYTPAKYATSSKVSIANALFLKNTFNVKDEYKNTLQTTLGADVILDSFETPDTINNWVKNKTFSMIDKLYDDVSDLDFALVNSLAFNLEWKNKFFPNLKGGTIGEFAHENFESVSVDANYSDSDGKYTIGTFNINNQSVNIKQVKFATVINKYDIITTLGEDNMKTFITNKYNEWVATDPCMLNGTDLEYTEASEYVSQYMSEIGANYKYDVHTTDYAYYVDDNVKVLAKDLAIDNGNEFQYVGIMPKNVSLDSYIKDIGITNINSYIDSLKIETFDNAKEGAITKIVGTTPIFDYEYEIDLVEPLKNLGVSSIFDVSKSDLSNMAEGITVSKVSQKANIMFNNDGIKASAASIIGGAGSGGCRFEYKYDVPVETIDLTFDKPYMYIIREKNTGEVWFMGTVYEPVKANN